MGYVQFPPPPGGESKGGGYIDDTVVELAIHCGRIPGGFGCDLGGLPAPPAELAIVFYAVGAAGLAIGAFEMVSGRLPVRVGWLKEIWSKRAARLTGVSLVIQSLLAVLLGWETSILSRHTVPSPGWLGLFSLPVAIVSLSLDWWAHRLDRRRPLRTS